MKKQKEIMKDKIMSFYKNQTEQIDNSKKIIIQNLSQLSQILTNTLRMIQKLESKI